jgi:hypothetical protein
MMFAQVKGFQPLMVKISDRSFALAFFYANPDEWDALEPYVRDNELEACGWLLRQSEDYTWLKVFEGRE